MATHDQSDMVVSSIATQSLLSARRMKGAGERRTLCLLGRFDAATGSEYVV
jgi:hypothetical protein